MRRWVSCPRQAQTRVLDRSLLLVGEAHRGSRFSEDVSLGWVLRSGERRRGGVVVRESRELAMKGGASTLGRRD